MDVRRRREDRQRMTLPIHQNVIFRALLAPIPRVLAGLGAPFLAGTVAASALARLQSIWRAMPSSSSRGGGVDARHRRDATLGDVASRSSRNHSPSRGAASPRGCPSARLDPADEDARRWVWAAGAGAAAQSRPRAHQVTVPLPYSAVTHCQVLLDALTTCAPSSSPPTVRPSPRAGRMGPSGSGRWAVGGRSRP
jgi:hypothetical protein